MFLKFLKYIQGNVNSLGNSFTTRFEDMEIRISLNVGKKQLEIITVSRNIILGNKGSAVICPHSFIRYVWTTS